MARTSRQTGQMGGRTTSGEDIPILRPQEIRQLKERHTLVVAENSKPIIARLTHCNEGKPCAQLLTQQEQVRSRLSDARRMVVSPETRMVVTPEARPTALVEAKRRGPIDHRSE